MLSRAFPRSYIDLLATSATSPFATPYIHSFSLTLLYDLLCLALPLSMYLPLYKNRAVSRPSQKLIASLTLFALTLLHPPSYCSLLSPTTPREQADPIGTT